MLTTRKIYQNIIRCDMKSEAILSRKTKKTFVKDFIDDDSVKGFHRSETVTATAKTATAKTATAETTTAKSFHNENFENNNFMTNVLIVAANSDIDENLDFSAVSFKSRLSLSKKTRNRKLKINKFDNFLRFLNVHVDLHLSNNVREYETVMNVNVLVEKMKHMFNILSSCLYYSDVINRSFKTMIDNAVSSNFMKYLIAKNVMTQSMRFELIDAWNHSHSKLVKILNYVDVKCLILIQSFLSSHERTSKQNNEHRAHHVREDDTHHNAQLFLFDYVLDNQNHLRMKASFKLMKLSNQHFFVQQLMIAYRRDYNIDVLNFDTRLFKWYQKIAYTNK